MNGAFTAWTSGIANFLNVGRSQGEASMASVSGDVPPFWSKQGNTGGFVPFLNIQGRPPNGKGPRVSATQVDEYGGGNGVMTQVDYSRYSPSIPSFATASYTSISGIKQIVSITDIGNVVAHYYDLGRYVGNGGAIRFFLLCKQIKHSFVNISLSDEEVDIRRYSPALGAVDSRLSFPLLIHNDRYHLYGTSSALRYVARKIGEYGIDTYRDYVLDAFSDCLLEWRNSLLLAILESMGESSSSERKDVVRNNVRKIMSEMGGRSSSGLAVSEKGHIRKYLDNRRMYFETAESMLVLYNSNPFIPFKGDVLLSGPRQDRDIPVQLCNSPSYSELILFSILYDDSIFARENGENQPSSSEILRDFPKISNLFNAVTSYPLITQWYREVEELDASEDEGRSSPPSKSPGKSTLGNRVPNSNSAGTPTDVSSNTINAHLGSGRGGADDANAHGHLEGVDSFTSDDVVPLNGPRTTNTVTYRLAPPKSQVIFPSSSQKGESGGSGRQAAMGSVSSSNRNAFNAIRISNFEPTFRPSNPQPSVNVRIANFSQLDNYRHQVEREQRVSSSRHYANFNAEARQGSQNLYPNYVPSTFR